MIGWSEEKMRAALKDGDCFWGLKYEDGYLEFPLLDNTGIAVSVWKGNMHVKPHRHAYYEFALVVKGSCVHDYKGVQVPLIPGDVYLIEPHQEHSYSIQASVDIINCNFIAEGLGNEFDSIISDASRKRTLCQFDADTKRNWDELIQYVSLKGQDSRQDMIQSCLNTQGIIHLQDKEMEEVKRLLWAMIDEQANMDLNADYVKMAYLQLVLIFFKRVQTHKNQRISNYSRQKQGLIYDALSYIEEHLDERIDFDEVSRNLFLSPSHFRAVFKDVTGFTPVEYMNRMRIIKSLEYLENDQLTITDAAAKVGIYDANYYSRIFKKIMGYSPRFFLNMRAQKK